MEKRRLFGSWQFKNIIGTLAKNAVETNPFFKEFTTEEEEEEALTSTPIMKHEKRNRKRSFPPPDDSSKPANKLSCLRNSLMNEDDEINDPAVSFVNTSYYSAAASNSRNDEIVTPEKVSFDSRRVVFSNHHESPQKNFPITVDYNEGDNSANSAYYSANSSYGSPARPPPSLQFLPPSPLVHASFNSVVNVVSHSFPLSNGTGVLPDAEKFTFFFTKKYPFSNHFQCSIEIEGKTFTCTEQYYMYKKAETFNDTEAMEEILDCDDPKQMKIIGSRVKGFKQKEWDSVSEQIMFNANFNKYTQNKELRWALFATEGTTLVETNPTDQRWGIGLSMDNEMATRRETWRGLNMLGRILTMIRDSLMKNEKFAKELDHVRRKPRRHLWWKDNNKRHSILI